MTPLIPQLIVYCVLFEGITDGFLATTRNIRILETMAWNGMHSRAFLLLRRDLIRLEKSPLVVCSHRTSRTSSNSESISVASLMQGIVAHPQNDDLFNWSAKIEGLGGTTWEGSA